MIRVKTNALTEKGQVRPAVRTSIVNKIANDRDMFAKAVRVDEKGQFYIPVEDNAGNVIYINFEVTVSTNCIADRAPKARKPKADNNSVDFE